MKKQRQAVTPPAVDAIAHRVNGLVNDWLKAQAVPYVQNRLDRVQRRLDRKLAVYHGILVTQFTLDEIPWPEGTDAFADTGRRLPEDLRLVRDRHPELRQILDFLAQVLGRLNCVLGRVASTRRPLEPAPELKRREDDDDD